MQDSAKKLKSAIGEYCRKRVVLCLCDGDQCDDCPMNDAYSMAQKDAVGKKTYRVFNINYSVTEEDVDFEGKNVIGELKASLPKEFTFEVSADEAENEYDLDDVLTDKISNETGFMVESFEYREIITHGDHNFEVVDAVPPGYLIWNIHDMGNGYLPLCRLKAEAEFDGSRAIEPDTLKAIKMRGAHKISQVVCYGYDDKNAVARMKEYLARHPNPTPMTREYTLVSRIKEALPFMEDIVWE